MTDLCESTEYVGDVEVHCQKRKGHHGPHRWCTVWEDLEKK
jgi:hypothetical protein